MSDTKDDSSTEHLGHDILVSITHKLLVLLFGWLVVPMVTHGWLTSDIAQRILHALDNWATIIAATIVLFLYPVIRGGWERVVMRAKIAVAATANPTTPEVVNRVVDSLPKMEKYRLATSPGNVPIPDKGAR